MLCRARELDLADDRPTLGQGPGFVEDNLTHKPEPLERLASSHQDAVFGSLAGASTIESGAEIPTAQG